jgi:hypothetical protein
MPPFLPGCPIRAVLVGLFGAVLLTTPAALAQQVAVDDAGITEPGACQLEAWVGRLGGWVLPACTPFSRTELTLGVGYVDEPHGDYAHRRTEVFGEAKVNLIPDDLGTVGVSVVAGAGWGFEAGLPFEGAYAYFPATYTLPTERALVHANLGWAYETGARQHVALYGLRADLALHDRVTVLAEAFGVGTAVGAQGGLRVSVLPDLLALDATYGATLRGDAPDLGFTLGLSLTPAPFFRPLRL